MHITDYLIRIAEGITDRPLPRFSSMAEFHTWRKQRQAEFHKMIGIDTYLHTPRTDLNVTRTGTLQREEFRIEKLHYESLPGLYVAANLYIPHELDQPAPALLYLCGHTPSQKVRYQEHGRRLAQLGFVVLILDTIQFGEVQGIHHGTYSHGQFNWISQGYTPTGVEVWNAIRGLDLLEELPEVDNDRLGVTGNSGGGSISWWTACADDRIKVLAPTCGTGTIASHIREQTINGHCDCVHPNNPYGRSLIEWGALVAPRPLLIVSPDRDHLFLIDSVRLVYDRLKELYQNLGFEDAISMMEFRGAHGYSPEARKSISQWFLRHLKSQEVGLEQIADFDGITEAEEDLLVFGGNPPANDRSTSVQDWFIPPAEAGKFAGISSLDEIMLAKQKLISDLQAECFATFPEQPVSPNVVVRQQSLDNLNQWHHKFFYQTETDIQLNGNVKGRQEAEHIPSPATIYLRSATEYRRQESISALAGLDEKWLKVQLDLRGIGSTSWSPELNWYVRRSLALTGRTVASIRIWDALQGIRAVRSLPYVDKNQIVLAGKGEMAVVAMYAALLDGNIDAVILKDAPASLRIPGDGDGLDPATEVMNSLRYADLPDIAALLWPTRIVFLGDRPSSYQTAEDVHRRLGSPGGVWRVKTLAEWRTPT